MEKQPSCDRSFKQYQRGKESFKILETLKYGEGKSKVKKVY